MKTRTMKPLMSAREILQTIPHRFPFVYVDGILACEGRERIVGFKNISGNEAYLYRLARSLPRFPESLIAECMAQVGAVAILSLVENRGKLMLFAAVDNIRFYKSVHPGDRLISEIRPVYSKGSVGKMKAVATVEDQLVAEGEFTYALADSISIEKES